ncbi:MAG: hypothetical protein SNJ77_07435 [Cytophagales bacterium]
MSLKLRREMDSKLIEEKLVAIVEMKTELSRIGYDDKRYDDLEEELHDLEDDFIEEFGDYFEGVLDTLHDQICPDSDVLLPTAYLPKTVKKISETEYDIEGKEGVLVDAEAYKGKDTRLVLIPGPTRFVLLIGGKEKKEVWKA